MFPAQKKGNVSDYLELHVKRARATIRVPVPEATVAKAVLLQTIGLIS